jgi:cystathionine gamma-synthase
MPLQPDSWLVSAGRPEEKGSPLNMPLVAASNFLLDGDRSYARDDGTPTWVALESLVGGLEGGESLAFSSGMAAVAAVFDLLPAGADIVIPDDCYQGVSGLAAAGQDRGRWNVARLPVEDTLAWSDQLSTADLLWLESPTNPLLSICDLKTICAAPRKTGSMLVVDNTFCTPLNQNPLELGADISMQSATKFIGGHSDLLAGILTTRDAGLLEKLRHSRTLTGAVPGALEAFLAVRGARTMSIRLERAQASAGHLAEFLQDHDAVERVRYPGLSTHPGHAVAAAQLKGFGSIVSFDVRGGASAADRVCRSVTLIRHATSLGSVETTMERRGAVSGQEHLPPGLLRLSVGIESHIDLEEDLKQALDRV